MTPDLFHDSNLSGPLIYKNDEVFSHMVSIDIADRETTCNFVIFKVFFSNLNLRDRFTNFHNKAHFDQRIMVRNEMLMYYIYKQLII